jgi:hypothetical protein
LVKKICKILQKCTRNFSFASAALKYYTFCSTGICMKAGGSKQVKILSESNLIPPVP